jgi:hypothetical protein
MGGLGTLAQPVSWALANITIDWIVLSINYIIYATS